MTGPTCHFGSFVECRLRFRNGASVPLSRHGYPRQQHRRRIRTPYDRRRHCPHSTCHRSGPSRAQFGSPASLLAQAPRATFAKPSPSASPVLRSGRPTHEAREAQRRLDLPRLLARTGRRTTSWSFEPSLRHARSLPTGRAAEIQFASGALAFATPRVAPRSPFGPTAAPPARRRRTFARNPAVLEFQTACVKVLLPTCSTGLLARNSLIFRSLSDHPPLHVRRVLPVIRLRRRCGWTRNSSIATFERVDSKQLILFEIYLGTQGKALSGVVVPNPESARKSRRPQSAYS